MYCIMVQCTCTVCTCTVRCLNRCTVYELHARVQLSVQYGHVLCTITHVPYYWFTHLRYTVQVHCTLYSIYSDIIVYSIVHEMFNTHIDQRIHMYMYVHVRTCTCM